MNNFIQKDILSPSMIEVQFNTDFVFVDKMIGHNLLYFN